MMPNDFSSGLDDAQGEVSRLALGSRAILLHNFAASRAPELVAAIKSISAISPFRHMVTPGGWEMSVALTNCGEVGWITDRSGYRCGDIDRVTDRAWPAMPPAFAALAAEAADA